MSLPKVLIVNQSFNYDTGGGITLSNLFCNWERKKLAVACYGYLLTEKMDSTLCNNYYQLGSKERKWIFPLNLFSRNYYSGPISFNDKKTNKVIVTNRSKFRGKLILHFVSPVLDYIGISQFQTKTKLSSGFCRWLDEFDPDVYYMQASSRENILFCIEVIKYKKRPVVFHMMDDWPSYIGIKGPFESLVKRKIDREFRLLLNKADTLMAISEFMAQDYKRRYGKEFKVFHNPININFWKKAQKNKYVLQENPVLLYAGRVGLGIDSSLKTVAEAIQKVNLKLGISMKFQIQTSEAPAWVKNYSFIEHRKLVPYEKLPEVFSSADFLILPYDFEEKSMSFIKYSMPTKAPEYMVSGTPVIVFSPDNNAIVEYAKKGEWAKIVTKNDKDVLAEAIIQLIKSKDLRKKLSQRAVCLAETTHDTQQVTRRFGIILQGLTGNKQLAN